MSANNDLQTMLASLERDRGISRTILLEAIQTALEKAAQKSMGTSHDVRVEIGTGKGEVFKLFQSLIVSDEVKGIDYISPRRARLYKPDAKVGDIIEIEVKPSDFGRIAAQVAKQTILQKIREAERDVVYAEYKDSVGRIVIGKVKTLLHRDVIVELGRAEAILPAREAIPGEVFSPGDPLRAYLLRVQGSKPEEGEPVQDTSGPGLVLSRRCPEFIKALFRQECAEIADGTVEIMGISREAGFRTKMAVRAHDEKVDPVGACVGMRGARVKNVVNELHGEKIDIIQWSPDLYAFARAALAPANVLDLWEEDYVDKEGRPRRRLNAIITPEQYSLTIGRRGLNVRLTSQLLGIDVNVTKSEPEPSAEDQYHAAVDALAAVPGIGEENAQKLVDAGYHSVEGILDPANDFRNAAEFDGEFVEAVWNAALDWKAAHPDEEDNA